MFAMLTIAGALMLAPAPHAPAAVQDPAQLLPADTLLYNGTDSLRAGSEAGRKSAMHLIFNEPEVKAFLNKPLSVLDHVLGQAAKEQGFEAPPITMSDLVLGGEESPPVGRVFIAVTHFDMSALQKAFAEGTEPSPPDIGLVVGLEMLNEADLGQLRGLWDMIPAEQEVASYGGHEVFAKHAPDGSLTVRLTFLDRMAVASTSQRSLEAVIDRAGGKGASLADSTSYKQMVKASGGSHAGGSTTFLRPAAMMGLARSAIVMGLEQEGNADMIPVVESVLDGLGIEAFQAIGMTSYRDGDGLVHGLEVIERDAAVGGLLPEMMMSQKAVDMDAMRAMPGDSMAVTAASVPRLSTIYDFVMDIVESVEPKAAQEIRDSIGMVMSEDELRRTILDNVGGSMTSFALANQTIMGTPATVYRVEARDPAAFVEGLQRIAAFASEESGFPVSIKATADGDGQTYTLDLSKTPAAMMVPGMQPGFAVDGNALLMSMESLELVKQTLAGGAGTGRLGDHAGFTKFSEGLASRGEILALTYTDTRKMFESMYGQMAGAAQMFGGGMGDLPVDLALLPTQGAISKHLGDSFSGSYRNADGTLIFSRSQSQFEMGDFMPLLVMGAGLFFLGQSGELESAMASTVDPRERVLADLGKIKAGLTVCKFMEKAYPETLDAIVQPRDDFPNGYMGSLELPLDPWGHGYLYVLEDGKPKLWSAGPDGVDQLGAGDDILKVR